MEFASIVEVGFLFIRDPDRIQTCNPQSRNLMRYSVAPRGLVFFLKKRTNKNNNTIATTNPIRIYLFSFSEAICRSFLFPGEPT